MIENTLNLLENTHTHKHNLSLKLLPWLLIPSKIQHDSKQFPLSYYR